jgi:peroxiredoxin (alkyl hydroperoxide reductase subunit C)
MSIRVGQPVPDIAFETYDPVAGDFAKFSLADQKKNGRWTILFFYPADFTFVCATEFEALADHQDHFKKLGCDIVTMSKDTKYTHLAWRSHEKELANVKTAVRDLGVAFPVAIDNDFANWNRYNNRYWPTRYLIDKQGVLRYTHIGEGAYAETRAWIEQLLGE